MPDYGHDLAFGTFITPRNDRPEQTVALARLTERAGLDLATFQDHPYQPAFLDTWTLLSWVAAQTTTLKVAPNVLNLPLRPPAVLARAAASLDLLSGGRVELGIGSGAFWDGIEAMGGARLTPGQGVDALSEAIDVIRAIWDTTERGGVRVDGEHHRVRGAKRGPEPAHDIALWLGAYKPRMLRLTGRKGDGWLPSLSYLSLADVPGMNAAIDEAADGAGRDPREIRRLLNVSGGFDPLGRGFLQGPAAQWVEELLPLVLEHGFSTFILSGDDPDAIERFGAEVAPGLREAVARERAAAGVATPAGPIRGPQAKARRRDGIDYDGVPAALVDGAVEPGDRGYAKARSTYVHRGAPGLVLRPGTPAEVAEALAFARAQDVPLAIRSGGHGIGGRATNDGGVVLDLGRLDGVEVLDRERRLVRLGPGGRWGDVAQALAPHGLALSSGDHGGVGVGGLATAGGVGYLVRRQGLTIDRIRAAELVLADGTLVRADAAEHPDLLWAVRGAGANVGIVTAFELEALELDDVIFASLLFDADAGFLQRYGEATAAAPRDLTAFLTLFDAPGRGPVAQVHAVFSGSDPEVATAALTPLLGLGTLLDQQAQLLPWSAVMAPVRGTHVGGAAPAIRSGLLDDLDAPVAEGLVDLVASGVAPMVQIRPVDGAVHDLAPGATAFAHRSQRFAPVAVGRRADELDARWDAAIAPAVRGLYLSFDTTGGERRLHEAYPEPTLTRLRQVKAAYDPDEVFDQNFPVRPLAAAGAA